MMKTPVSEKTLNTLETNDPIQRLYDSVAAIIDESRSTIARTINKTQVVAYWHIGKHIVQEEQKGHERAKYGTYLLTELAERLKKDFGKGFGYSTLKDMRQFYLVYADELPIRHSPRGELVAQKFNVNLSWTHYRELMRIDRPEARSFYEKEASENCWSARELKRQIGSLLFDRLAKSRDKEGLLALAQKGQEINRPEDVFKDPVVLEFLNLPEAHQLTESKVEEALINNLQHFLLELGKGFAFIARQKRLTLDSDHFYADLVFYHVVLKCYVIIDLKTHPLTHADLGQMQLYVNYFDKEICQEGDNPTLGLVLCTQKNTAMVKYMLGDKAQQIFTSRYQFHLPTEKELEIELKREIALIESELSVDK